MILYPYIWYVKFRVSPAKLKKCSFLAVFGLKMGVFLYFVVPHCTPLYAICYIFLLHFFVLYLKRKKTPSMWGSFSLVIAIIFNDNI